MFVESGIFLVALIVLSILTSIPANVGKKVMFYFFGILYMIQAKDAPSKYAKGNNFSPKSKVEGHHAEATKPVRVRVVFVRHGDSYWNSLINRFGLGWPIRAVKALLTEWYLFLTNASDSVIIDSPLSSTGKKQASELAEFVRKDAGKTVPCQPKNSVVVTSNLRRAMLTALVGLGPRVSTAREKIVMDSSLQEASRNIDALSFSVQKRAIAATPIGENSKTVLHLSNFDPILNMGQKTLPTSTCNVHTRIEAFVDHLLAGVDNVQSRTVPALRPSSGSGPLEEVIVVGHSLWFKTFFNRFLPAQSTHIGKKKKMMNCAMVSFDLVWDRNGSGDVSIDESTITPMFKNFNK